MVFELNRIQEEAKLGHIAFQPELPSTNDHALELAAEDHAELPLLVLTETQTAGRGRGANRWWAAPGALTCSVLIEMHPASLPAQSRPKVSLTAGLAVCEALRELLRKQKASPQIGLKWPNDVLLSGRKVCGILVEASSARADRLVIGIGLNVNNSLTQAPAELQQTATALVDVIHTPLDLTDTLIEVLQQLAAGLHMLTAADEALFECFKHYCVLQGRRVCLDLGTRQVVGLCLGIDPDGALVVDTDFGPQRFFSGVVRMEN